MPLGQQQQYKKVALEWWNWFLHSYLINLHGYIYIYKILFSVWDFMSKCCTYLSEVSSYITWCFSHLCSAFLMKVPLMNHHCNDFIFNLIKVGDVPSFCLPYLCYTDVLRWTMYFLMHFQRYHHENFGAGIMGSKIGESQSTLF